ncbi:Conserved_hypothetical protein [Hexamita inflata]|uniref:Uncharacterized protein n=1 Tax=Hexamita inflata TaxID=28002 RepID=A0AA86NLP5_9EUKA|nr:Conserved hypothetical protein [Hexamita inflata]
MDGLHLFLKDKPLVITSESCAPNFLQKMNTTVSDSTQALLKSSNAYRLGLIHTVSKEVDLGGDFPACYTRTDDCVAVASKSGVVSIFEKSNLKLPRQQLTVPGAKISQMLLVDEPQTLILAMHNGTISVNTRQGMITKTLKEQVQIKEHAEKNAQITSLQLLPAYQSDQPESAFISTDNQGNIFATRLAQKITTNRLGKQSESIQSLNIFKLPKLVLADVKPFKQNQIEFTVLLAVTTQSKCTIYALNNGETFNLFQIGEPIKRTGTGQVFFSSSSFINVKQLLLAVNFETEMIISKIVIKNSISYKDCQVQQVNSQCLVQNHLKDDKILQVQFVTEKELLCFGQESYYIIDPFTNVLIEQVRYPQRLAGFVINSFFYRCVNQVEILSYEAVTQIISFEQLTVEQRIEQLGQNYPLCAFELLTSIGMACNNFKSACDVLLERNERIELITQDDSNLLCFLQAKQNDLCCKLVVDQLSNESWLVQFLRLAEASNQLNDTLVQEICRIVLSGCVFVGIMFNQIGNILTKWKSQQNAIQDYIRKELVRILLVQLSNYQIPMPANIFNYLLNQLPKEFVQTHPNSISLLAMNAFDATSSDQFYTLCENNQWPQLIPLIFFHQLYRSPNDQAKTVMDNLYSQFLKWLIAAIKLKNPAMLQAFACFFRAAFSSDPSYIQKQFVASAKLDLLPVLDGNMAVSDDIQCYSFADGKLQPVQRKPIYYLPPYLSQVSFITSYQNPLKQFSQQIISQLAIEFQERLITKQVLINNETPLIFLWNVIDPVNQLSVFDQFLKNTRIRPLLDPEVRKTLVNNISELVFHKSDASGLVKLRNVGVVQLSRIILACIRSDVNSSEYSFLNEACQQLESIKLQVPDQLVPIHSQIQCTGQKLATKHYQYLLACVFNQSLGQEIEKLGKEGIYNPKAVDAVGLGAHSSKVFALQLIPTLYICKQLLKECTFQTSQNIQDLLIILQHSSVEPQIMSTVIMNFANSQTGIDQMLYKMIAYDLALNFKASADTFMSFMKDKNAALLIKYISTFETFSKVQHLIKLSGDKELLKQSQQLITQTFDFICKQYKDESELKEQLLPILSRAYKFCPVESYQTLMTRPNIWVEFLLIMLDPQLASCQSALELQTVIRASVSQIVKTEPSGLQILFCGPMEQSAAITKWQFELLLVLQENLDREKFLKILVLNKTALLSKETVAKYVSAEGHAEFGLFMLKLINDTQNLNRVLIEKFEEVVRAPQVDEQFILFLNQSLKDYLTEPLTEENKPFYFKLLKLAFSIKSEARFTVLNRLSTIFEKLMTVDKLCQLVMQLFENATWGEAHKLINSIIKQVDVSNIIQKEQANIASVDLQTCQMHKTNNQKTGVICTNNACICGQSIFDAKELEHTEHVQLQDSSKLEIKLIESADQNYFFGCGHCCHHQCLNETPESKERKMAAVEKRICGGELDECSYVVDRIVRCPECK